MATAQRILPPPSTHAVAAELDAPMLHGRRSTDLDDPASPSTGCLTVMVDGFERFDGSAGTASGLHVLDLVARQLQAAVRSTDIVFRHKDAGFTVLLPGTTDAKAREAAHRLRTDFDSVPVSTEPPISVTIAAAIGAPERIIETVERADAALARDAESAGLVIVDERLADPN